MAPRLPMGEAGITEGAMIWRGPGPGTLTEAPQPKLAASGNEFSLVMSWTHPEVMLPQSHGGITHEQGGKF